MQLRRALTSAGVVAVLLTTAGCNATSGANTSSEPTATPPTSGRSSPGNSPTVVIDGEHAVDPPGPRTGVIAPADIVVSGAKTIPQDKVDAIRKLAGIQAVEQISMASVPVENRTISVAAVDPVTYRNWVTKAASAQTRVIWNRVAGGELAIRPALEKRAPIDKNGFLALGSTSDATKVHVGAHAAQSWLVDAVVNDTWIKDIDGMTEGNALLIRTGGDAPDPLRKPIERILKGTDATVSMTDAVARYGLDPGIVQTALVVGTVADAVGVYRYTVLGGGHIAPDPAWVREHITTEVVPILGAVTCNKLVFPQLTAALNEIRVLGLADKIHPGEYAGCYYPRFIAGTTSLSNHSFGLALDLNVPGNQRGTVGEMDRDVVSIFKKWGFAWGGDWGYTDPMHFEMNALVDPR